MAASSSSSGQETFICGTPRVWMQNERKKLIGFWVQTNHSDRYMTYEKTDRKKYLGRQHSLEIGADGKVERTTYVEDHEGRLHDSTVIYDWMFSMPSPVDRWLVLMNGSGGRQEASGPQRFAVREVSDSTLILTVPEVVKADSILSFSDFEKIERFVRSYGDRKTFGNRWNDNPHFQFATGEVYLFPCGEYRLIDEPAPYHYFGFRIDLKNRESHTIEYLSKDYIDLREQGATVLKSIADDLLAEVEQYPETTVQEGKLMANEGSFKLTPVNKSDSIHDIQIRNISTFDYEYHQDDVRIIPLSIEDTEKEIDMTIVSIYGPSNRNCYLKKIVQTQKRDGNRSLYHYTLYFDLDGKECSLPVRFFGGNAIVEGISSGLFLKVRYLNPQGAKELPASEFYYALMLVDPTFRHFRWH